MRITSFTAWLIESDPPPQFRWRNGLPSSFGDLPDGKGPKRVAIRMKTDEGYEGYVEIDSGDAVLDIVRRRFGFFVGEDPLLTERIWTKIWEVDRMEEFHLRHLGILDLLCWDVKSKRADMPIYQLLGGDRRAISAYASTVTWPTLDDFERNIKTCRDVGFQAFKLHAWGDVKQDIRLIRALRKWVGPDADLMFDGSAGWDYVDAMIVGKALQDEGYLWYEEPMREFYLGAYAKLAAALDIPILAAETSDGVHWNMASWIEAGALDMTRVSYHYKGGLTGSIKIAHLSESFGMRAQVHGMGLANAQLCAAISNNDFYEQIVFDEDHIQSLHRLGENQAIVDGVLKVNDRPGIGHACDAEYLDRKALAKVTVDRASV